MPRTLLALPLALLLATAPVLGDSAQSHVSAAHKAERAGNWHKAIEEWKAAYKLGNDIEYLVSLGDAYARLGDKPNAKRQYEAYLADPLALGSDAVKAKIAALDSGGGLDLGGLPPDAAGGLSLDGLGGVAPAPAADSGKGKKGKKGKKDTGAGDLGLDMPGAPAATADRGGLSLDLPATPAPAAKKDTRVAVADTGGLSLDMPAAPAPAANDKNKKGKRDSKSGGDLGLDLGALAVAPAPAAPAPSAPPTPKPAAAVPAPSNAGTRVATSSSSAARQQPRPETRTDTGRAAPTEALSSTLPDRGGARNGDQGGSSRILAYVTAGLALGSLTAGGLYYSKASQDASDLHSGVRSGTLRTAQLDSQKQHKSLSFAGFAGGLVLAGIATAMFAF